MVEFRRIRILSIFTDEPQLIFGASSLLSASGDFDVTAAPVDASLLARFVECSSPDLILVDVVPAVTFELLASLREAAPATRVILWARSFTGQTIAQGRELGVAGFINRTCDNAEFVDVVRGIAEGGQALDGNGSGCKRPSKIQLTPRESQLLAVLAQGLKNKQIARCLAISEGTVRIYLSRLFEKAGARDRFELALFAWQNAYCGQLSWDTAQDSRTEERKEAQPRPLAAPLRLVKPPRREFHNIQSRAVGL